MLQGTLDTLSFAEVLVLAARKGLTSSLQVKTAKGRTVIHIQNGRIFALDGEDVTSADFRRRAEDTIAHLLTAERGSFELRPSAHADDVDGGVEIEAALEAARQLLAEWREVEAAIPSLDARPRLVSNLDSQGVTLSREQWRLLHVIDGHRSVRALARLLGESQPEVARGLRTLLDVGAIQFDSPATVAVPLPGQAVHNSFDPDDNRATILISRTKARPVPGVGVVAAEPDLPQSPNPIGSSDLPGSAGPPESSGVAEHVERRRTRAGWLWSRRRRSGAEPAPPDPAAWPQAG